jgi:hypothetical protein
MMHAWEGYSKNHAIDTNNLPELADLAVAGGVANMTPINNAGLSQARVAAARLLTNNSASAIRRAGEVVFQNGI